ncbi:Botcinic acid biosynthesis cluster B protein 16 [Penicillium canariense]|uniref:Botcinic acid biosynthesis cluster B protein 16 n=1 Tax=Penicillium canariense TaxID=189055 RepID=A0A9W9I621_9EURO|nr:Botcinic acid biosynthesis cluster B protein 16 [Penicillium canariense]KAJ5167686.1 Botcinic acid biosynthesis cluster B protein 16 [Penicillium canariense]
MHIILTGATGLVGSAALVALRARPDISKISILSRRPVPMLEDSKDDRIEVIVHDFKHYDTSLQDRLRGAHGCVWALGISQTAVSKEEYIHITKTMTLEAAQAFEKLKSDESSAFNFVFVSGEGATSEPGRFTPLFGRVKGETESALMEMETQNPDFRPLIVRPAFVDPKSHQAILPWIPQGSVAKRVAETAFGPVIRVFFKASHSPTAPLGEFLAGLAMGKFDGKLKGEGVETHGGSSLITNVGFRRLMELN